MYFFIKNGDWLNKCNTICYKIRTDLGKELYSEPAYNRHFWKPKNISYDDEATDFHDKEVPNVDTNHTCFTVISPESILKIDKNYYPQVFLKNTNTLKDMRHVFDKLVSF